MSAAQSRLKQARNAGRSPEAFCCAAQGHLRQGRAAGPCLTARRCKRGFTLLELLIAITVLSVVSLIAWRGLDTLVATRDRLEPEANDVRALLTAFGQMERDLSQVTNPRFLGMTTSPVTVSIGDGAPTLNLVRVAPSVSERPTEVQTVTYRVVEGTLVRQASAALPSLQPTPVERLESARLLDRVKLMQVRTWSANGGWVDPNVPLDSSSPAAAGNAEIPGVEVTIERDDGRIFRRVLLVGS
jgi:general secretion pathway protein J